MTRPQSHADGAQTNDEHKKNVHFYALEPRISVHFDLQPSAELPSFVSSLSLEPVPIPASALNFHSIKFTNLLSFFGGFIYSRCGVHGSDSAAACFCQMQSVSWGSFNIGEKKKNYENR